MFTSLVKQACSSGADVIVVCNHVLCVKFVKYAHILRFC